ncbi:MAG: GxxExxY protein [Anaerolineales bacterium]|nr:GxxExxY protein [Anaerolineales bacterium]
MTELILKDEVYAIVGAAMEVYNQLGPGFSEAVYQEALEIESTNRNIPNNPQLDIFIEYKGQTLKKFFTPDLICFEKIIVEIKALDKLTSREEAQLLNYLKVTGMPVGLLINFGADNNLEWKRMVFTSQKSFKKPKIIMKPHLTGINDPKIISED